MFELLEMETPFTLGLPKSGSKDAVDLLITQSLVIVGANGSGKTRLGTWLDINSEQRDKAHRISAQKSLTMPESSDYSSLAKAEEKLLHGGENLRKRFADTEVKSIYRWDQKPNTALLNDFNLLMAVLFSEESEVSISHRKSHKENNRLSEIPKTRLDVVKEIWESILPEKELLVGSGIIRTKPRILETAPYNGSEMSDGERVIFYLIGQALSAPKNGILIIDEPELHLHKSIQTRLWLEIQSARPDCIFVYMTHDLDFAASMTEAKKIWLKSYDGEVWDWEEIPEIEGFPEALLLQVMGSRHSIIFVEGEEGSHDVALFRAIYTNHTITPRGSCSQVIFATKALNSSDKFHHIDAQGIIDRDRLSPEEVLHLQRDRIGVLNVAEVENLFCIPEILLAVAEQLNLPAQAKLFEVQEFIFKELRREIETQISLRVANEIKFQLNLFNSKKQGVSALKHELVALIGRIDVDLIYSEVSELVHAALQNKDYNAVLMLYNRKSLAERIGPIFGLHGKAYPNFVLRMLRGDKKQSMIEGLMRYIPNLDAHNNH